MAPLFGFCRYKESDSSRILGAYCTLVRNSELSVLSHRVLRIYLALNQFVPAGRLLTVNYFTSCHLIGAIAGRLLVPNRYSYTQQSNKRM
jgi:hypothetical protein